MLGLIKQNFKYLSVSSFILENKNAVRSHSGYCSSVLTPYRQSEYSIKESAKENY